MMGETVLVRLHKGWPKVLTVWSVAPDIAEVTTPEKLATGLTEGSALVTIGVRMDDVFEFAGLEIPNPDSMDWKKLRWWEPPKNSRKPPKACLTSKHDNFSPPK